MAKSGYERVVLNGLSLHEWGGIESLTFTPAAKKAQWVESGDSDGSALVRESHYTNSYYDIRVRVDRQENTTKALEALGELTDAMQGCERTAGGAECEWIPNETEPGYTFYALLAEITNIPVEVQGDMAGWFLSCPVIQLKVHARPFLYGAEDTFYTATETSAAPSHEAFMKVGGDVPAEAELLLTDKATQNRRYAQFGQDVVADEEPPACLILAANLVTEGFSGEGKTRSGAYSEEKVKRATAVSSATTICGTGRIKHLGSFAVYLRVYTASENARFRISYRTGDGPLQTLTWKAPSVTSEFSDLYMGEAFFSKVSAGEQSAEIRVEHKTLGSSHANDINYIQLMPTDPSCKARDRANLSPTKLLAYDAFEQTEGNLSGKSLNLGGEWSGAGDGADFTVIAAEDLARRNVASDANINTGRYALAGSGEYATSIVSAKVRSLNATSTRAVEESRLGVLLRYVNTENWLMAYLTFDNSGSDRGVFFRVAKRVSGTVTVLASHTLTTSGWEYWIEDPTTLRLAAYADGSWGAWAYKGTTPPVEALLSGTDTVLAPSGALDEGKAGIYDAEVKNVGLDRYVSNFELVGADTPGAVCYSGKELAFTSDGVRREDSAGEYWGQPDLPRGANFFLQPEGSDGRINRVVTRMRRNDVEAEADSAVTDKHQVEVKGRERFLLPR